MREIIETTINGHRYETVPLAFDDALALKADLLKVLAGPIAKALDAMGADALDAEVDLGKIGAALAMVPGAVAEAGGPALFARILHDTTRIVTGPDGKAHKQMLRDPHMRTAAFSGGNWGEFYEAVGWVVKVNYGPFLQVLKDAYNGLSGMLSALPSATATEG